MPSADSDSPLALALAWVTCPISFEPLGMITCPSCLTAWVVWAKTLSPSLFFLASSGLSSAASNVVPLEMLAEFCPACALADVEAEAFAEASVPEPFFSACGGADRSGRSRGGLDSCANAFHVSKAPAIIPTRFVSFATASLFERQIRYGFSALYLLSSPSDHH